MSARQHNGFLFVRWNHEVAVRQTSSAYLHPLLRNIAQHNYSHRASSR